MMAVRLYTTVGCHLCEQALSMLRHLNTLGPDFTIEEVEIADSERLMERFGIRIPVIQVGTSETGPELGWPFDLETLNRFIEEHK